MCNKTTDVIIHILIVILFLIVCYIVYAVAIDIQNDTQEILTLLTNAELCDLE